MPRGVYNRAKVKKAGRPAKTEVKAKRKYTRRNVAEAAPQATVESTFAQHAESPAVEVAMANNDRMASYELTAQLERLGSIPTNNAQLRAKLDDLMITVADQLKEAISAPIVKAAEVVEKAPKAAKAPKAPKIEAAPEEIKAEPKAEVAEEKNGKHTVLPAPVPFLAVPISS